MEQPDLLRFVVDVLETQDVVYMLVGSLASGAYGEPRTTHDIDLVVELRTDQVERLCAAFPADDFYVSLAAARAAVVSRGQFNVIHPTSGNKIDFMIARNDAWGREQVARRRRESILRDRVGFIAAPEDVILSKLLYYQEGQSDKHLRDVAAMMQVSGDEIDAEYIARWAAELRVSEIWQAILNRLGTV